MLKQLLDPFYTPSQIGSLKVGPVFAVTGALSPVHPYSIPTEFGCGYDVPPKSGRDVNMRDMRLPEFKPLGDCTEKAQVGFVAAKLFGEKNALKLGLERPDVRVNNVRLRVGHDVEVELRTQSIQYFNHLWKRLQLPVAF
jgi:hypothetical protein